ncbi:universal stress protein [Amycolatopsis australiensis]|uniref:Nucleotide-binding universal stress protein, UspA family n=1 Tax=Amycolatopsis australiensis TaxID=546364 RepID=A0A1K1SH32_9PSEU|nr:universal stress protein [Amycolatopsis australiensis]SFW83681.1 Nucleotide-binding universal stress protein, UspA family [Amycolatopsis australiensis]
MTAAAAPIVTGVDGSAESLDAVRWAARTACLRDAPLEIVHALDVPALLAGGVVPPPEEMVDALRARGRRALRTARELAAAQGVPGAATRLDPDRAAQALIEASRTAALLVVGAAGHGRLTGLLAGSVAAAVGTHARCDTVVVRGDSWDEPGAVERPIVTGVDGSEAGRRVLAAALAEARWRRAPLVVLHAWADTPPPHADPRYVTEAGHRLLGEWLPDTGDVDVEQVVVHAHPRRELIERSGAAQLVVLGDRGRGGFPGLLLGSTGQALLHHAACPVLLVRTR